ncbi:hypothetical protein [Alteraurantiacibacter buctensis]|uniref:Uncharacterized protein n=1 Tax=Alteraurantiacibacter buctensis TaxID=1503981 RepID=A0A844Z0Y8_9SPHN|nr:hypothetical protein [Alteraurantiacibacter buctensis]MXO72374.1 hypothetical protein [Alteraurantiacibacter buctensis]
MIPLPSTLTLVQLRERLSLANSYNRLPILLDLAWQAEWADWLTVLGEEWQSCDNIGLHLDELLEQTPLADVIDQPKALRQWLMTADEVAALDALPEVVTVWRGCYQSNKWGLSWSLDRDKAAAFPSFNRYRQDGQPLLVKARIARDDILALKLERNEAEVIAVRPKHVSTSHLPLD